MNMLHNLISPRWQPVRAAIVGVIATLFYSVAMEGDQFLTGNRFSDVRFIQGMLEGKRRSQGIWLLSWVIHVLNGVLLAEVYGAVAKRLLPGPGWLRGAIFGEAFVVSVWPLTPLADKYHPLIRDGEMPKLANWTSFLQNLVRHLVFGLALGLLYKDKHP